MSDDAGLCGASAPVLLGKGKIMKIDFDAERRSHAPSDVKLSVSGKRYAAPVLVKGPMLSVITAADGALVSGAAPR
jgi:hypothetical protein